MRVIASVVGHQTNESKRVANLTEIGTRELKCSYGIENLRLVVRKQLN